MSDMAAMWLARRAARRLPPLLSRQGGEPTRPWFLGSTAPPPVLGSPPLPAVERIFRRGFCSVRRFAGESSAAAAADADEEEPENGFAGGDQVMGRRPPHALASAVQHAS